MKTTPIRSIAVPLIVLGFATLLVGADSPRIHSDRPSPQTLPLPKGDDVFHFVVFGDRTGGPDEGIEALYIGARPSPAWNVHNFSQPAGFWKGSIDDVRVSRGVRYTADFDPSLQLPTEGETVVSISNDQAFGPFVPLNTPTAQALAKGAAKLIREAR